MAHIKIEKKIAKYRVQKPEGKDRASKDAPSAARTEPATADNVIWMHEKLERPEVLIGSTYKIKTPVSDHAMYVLSLIHISSLGAAAAASLISGLSTRYLVIFLSILIFAMIKISRNNLL